MNGNMMPEVWSDNSGDQLKIGKLEFCDCNACFKIMNPIWTSCHLLGVSLRAGLSPLAFLFE